MYIYKLNVQANGIKKQNTIHNITDAMANNSRDNDSETTFYQSSRLIRYTTVFPRSTTIIGNVFNPSKRGRLFVMLSRLGEGRISPANVLGCSKRVSCDRCYYHGQHFFSPSVLCWVDSKATSRRNKRSLTMDDSLSDEVTIQYAFLHIATVMSSSAVSEYRWPPRCVLTSELRLQTAMFLR